MTGLEEMDKKKFVCSLILYLYVQIQNVEFFSFTLHITHYRTQVTKPSEEIRERLTNWALT